VKQAPPPLETKDYMRVESPDGQRGDDLDHVGGPIRMESRIPAYWDGERWDHGCRVSATYARACDE